MAVEIEGIELLFGIKEPGQIGSITLDATISDAHIFRNRVTDFPIESGSYISDHAIQEPERLTIIGFITNSPIQYLGGIRAIGDEERIFAGLAELMSIAGYEYPLQPGSPAAVPNIIKRIDIVTGLRSYSDMVMTDLNIPRDSKTGESLRFNATFKRLRITESQLAIVLDEAKINDQIAARAKEQGATKKDIGVEKAVDVEESEADKIFDWLGEAAEGINRARNISLE